MNPIQGRAGKARARLVGRGRDLLGNLLKRRSRSFCGIDISVGALKLLALGRCGSHYRVENYACRPIPAQAVVEKHIDALEVVGEHLQQLAAMTRSHGAPAAVAVAASAAITRTIEMSASLNEAEMESQILVEADQYIPYPLDEVAIDFERLRVSPRMPERVEVVLAACKKEHVDRRVVALELGGFRAQVVDIEAYAMARAYWLLRQQMDLPESRLTAILDIGTSLSTLYILLEGEPIHTLEQAFAAGSLLEQVQNSGELRKMTSPSPGRAGERAENGTDSLQAFHSEVGGQLGRALQYFYSSSQYKDVDLIVLAGSAAGSPGLASQVQQSLSIHTVVANPFARMTVGPRVTAAALAQDAPALMLASGLALRAWQ